MLLRKREFLAKNKGIQASKEKQGCDSMRAHRNEAGNEELTSSQPSRDLSDVEYIAQLVFSELAARAF